MVAIMALRQRQSMREVGFRRKYDLIGLFLYFVFYQAVLLPVSLTGYFQELFGTRKRW